MKSAPDIFHLIHSLTPNEKGYFKKFCSRSGSRDSLKYLEIFDLIAAQTEYDEQKLRKKIKDPRTLKNLSAEKGYLYNQIIHSLSFSGSSAGPRDKVLELLNSARVLYMKSLYPLVVEQIKKAQTLCRAGGFHELHLEVINLEMAIWQYLSEDERKPLEDIFKERNELLNKIQLLDEAHQLNLTVIWSFTSAGVGRTTKVIQQREQWLARASEIAEKEKKFPCLRARVLILNTLLFLYNTLDEMDKTRAHLRELISLLESEPVLREDFMNLYSSSLSNYILVSFYSENIHEAEKEIEKLRNLKSSVLRTQLAIFVSRINAEFELYKRKHDFEAACRLAEEMKEELARLENLVPFHYLVQIVYFSFRSYFYVSRYKEALYWINHLANSDREIIREEVASIMRISEIMLHYELQHSELVLSLTRSAQRFLEKKHALYQFEKIMLDFFKVVYNKDEKAAFTELKNNLEPVFKDELEARVKTYFDFDAWVESKITGKSMKELIK